MSISSLGALCGEQVRCATYSVYVRNRVTLEPLEGCDFTQQPAEGKWTRKYSSATDPTPSTAEITLNTGSDPDCCNCLPVPWRDELVIERLDRNGKFEQVAWVGPIWNVIDDSVFGSLLVKAKDRTVWPLERQQFITEEIKLIDVDQSEVFMAVWDNLNSKQQSGLVPRPVPTGKIVSVEFPKHTAVADILNSIPDVFWSLSGETMYGPGPVELGHSQAPVATLDVASHWDEQGAVVDYNGRNSATCVLVRNQPLPAPVDVAAALAAAEDPNAQPRNDLGQFTSPGDPLQQESTDITQIDATPELIEAWFPDPCQPHPDFGVHCRVVIDETIESQAEAATLARATYVADHDGDAFLVTSAGSLGREAPVAVCDLDLGKTFNAVADRGCSDLEQLLRLNNLVVDMLAEETGRGVQLTESRVATDLQPLTNTRTSESRLSI